MQEALRMRAGNGPRAWLLWLCRGKRRIATFLPCRNMAKKVANPACRIRLKKGCGIKI